MDTVVCQERKVPYFTKELFRTNICVRSKEPNKREEAEEPVFVQAGAL